MLYVIRTSDASPNWYPEDEESLLQIAKIIRLENNVERQSVLLAAQNEAIVKLQPLTARYFNFNVRRFVFKTVGPNGECYDKFRPPMINDFYAYIEFVEQHDAHLGGLLKERFLFLSFFLVTVFSRNLFLFVLLLSIAGRCSSEKLSW